METIPCPKPAKKSLGKQPFIWHNSVNPLQECAKEPSPSAPCKPRQTVSKATGNESVSGMHLDKVTLHILWRETNNRVDVLRARVREGTDVMHASEFSRWLQFSGILRLLQEQPLPLPCRRAELEGKVEQLVAECGDWFANHERSNVQPHPQIPRTELERINAQLNDLAAAVSRLAPPTIETANAVREASLRVIEGGAK